MAHTGPVRRWDIFWADLEPHVGNEQGGERRPVIVVSNNGVNHSLGVVTVVSTTKLEGKKRKVYPFEVELPKGTITEDHATVVMPQQVRSISKMRLIEFIGRIEDDDHRTQIENRLLEHLDISFEAEEE